MEQIPPVLETQPPPHPSMSLAGRLFNIFATPGEVFESIREKAVSTANWLVPAILLMAVSWLGVWLVFSQDSIQQQLREITDQAIEKQVQKKHLSDAQAEQARAMGTKFAGVGQKVSGFGAPVFAGLVTPFWWGLIIWLVGAKALKGDFGYMKAVEVAGLSGMINVLDSILRTLLILIMGNLFASPSPALFVKQFDPQNPAHTSLAVLNVMTFWILAVRAIGLARLSNVSFGKAAAWVFGIWALWTGITIGFGLAMQAIFS